MTVPELLEGYQLSPQQERLWLLQQDCSAFRAQCVVMLEGRLDATALDDALQTVVERHEILRTVFCGLPEMKKPVQVIVDPANPLQRKIGLNGQGAPRELTAILKVFAPEAELPFDFQNGPLFRAFLLPLSTEQHALLLSLPSLCADGRTLTNLVREISQAYAARLKNEELSDEATQYIQFSEWQNELRETEDDAVSGVFWHQINVSDLHRAQLPFAKATGGAPFEPRRIDFRIEPELLAEIDPLAQEHGASSESFFLACWAILLTLLTRRPEIIIGAACDGRQFAELQDALGLFAKYVPAQFQLHGQYKFSEVLVRTHQLLSELQRWQDEFAWERVIKTEATNGQPGFFPLCFSFTEQPVAFEAGALKFSLNAQSVCIDRFELQLSLSRSGPALDVALYYDANQFRAEDIALTGAEFLTLIRSAVRSPHCAIQELDILGETMRRQLLYQFSSGDAERPVDSRIDQLFEAQASYAPDQVAVCFEDEQLTYGALNARANRLAHYLQRLGVKPEELVALCLDRSTEMLTGMLGTLKAGGAYVPLDPTLPAERLSFIIEDSRARVLITKRGIGDRLSNHLRDRVVYLDSDGGILALESAENPTSDARADNLLYVMYTSGSTGRPKGVAIEHRQLVNYVSGIQKRLALPREVNYATVSSFATDLGNTAIFPALCGGGTLHIISQERASDSVALADYFRTRRVDCLKIVPSHMLALLEGSEPVALMPQQRLIFGGEACSWELALRMDALSEERRVLNHYGPTETTVGALTYPIERSASDVGTGSVPLGRPIVNSHVYSLDNQLQPVPIWAAGELYIAGAGLARGYINRPDLTAEKFIPHPYSAEPGARMYKTGDLGRFCAGGEVEFLGRVDHQVKVRGNRIEPGEIEAVLKQRAEIESAVVILREDAPGDKRLVAYLVARRGREINTKDLWPALRERLPEHMIPAAFVVLKKLPVTPTGKIDREALPRPTQTRSESEKSFVAPRDEMEGKLAQIWQSTLGLQSIGVRDNFFQLGGHSLLAVRLLALIEESFGCRLPLATFFQGATIEQLAEALRRESQVQLPAALAPIQTGNAKTPFFCVHPASGLVSSYALLAKYLGPDQPFYGLRARGVDGEAEPHTQIEMMAAEYIAAIRVVQPKGPYLLGGWSLGGVIAHEMARQLQEQGEQIALLVLIDATAAPTLMAKFVRSIRRRNDWQQLALFGLHLGLPLDQFVRSRRHLTSLPADEQLKYLLELAIEAKKLPPNTELSWLGHLAQVFAAHTRLTKDYQPRTFHGRPLLFRAHTPVTLAHGIVEPFLRRQPYLSEVLDWRGKIFRSRTGKWKPFVTDGIEVHEIPGNHFTMLEEPHVQILARQIKAHLDLVNADGLAASVESQLKKPGVRSPLLLPVPLEKELKMSNVSISLKDVRKSFETVVAVDKVSFSVESGEIFGLLGPNGAGKTTMIRMIMDIIRPDQGSVEVFGHRMTEADKDRIGYLPEERGLYTRQKVLSVLEYFAQLKGKDRQTARRNALNWLERFGMIEVQDKKVKELSKGNQQKIQLIATLVSDPQIVILDEPFSGLDPVNTRLVSTLIRELADAGKTVLLSTHQMGLVETMCRRVFMINKGRQVFYGPLDEIKKQYSDSAVLVKSTAEYSKCNLISRYVANNGTMKVYLRDGVPTRELLRWLTQSGADIDFFQRAITPLEEIYIRVVEEAKEPREEKSLAKAG
jgi:amino acid adenylation domain-containing protein